MPTYAQCNCCSNGSSEGCDFYKRSEETCSNYLPPLDNTGMFNRPFGFNGRIGRLEMIISYAVYLISLVFGIYIAAFGNSTDRMYIAIVGYALLIGGMWFVIAQYTKRAHDCGMETATAIALGFFVRIVCLIYCFVPGVSGPNQFGSNPNEPYDDQVYKG